MKQLLNEIFYVEKESLNESVKTNEKGIVTLNNIILQKAEEKNRNGRIYPRAHLNREIEKLLPDARARRLRGECDHPSERLTVLLEHVSHMITDIWWEGNVVKGNVELFKTPKGLLLEAIVTQRSPLGISSRAEGSLKSTKDGEIVQEDLDIYTWDIVSNESTIGAVINESLKREFNVSGKDALLNLYYQNLNENLDKLFEQINNSIKEY